MIDNVKAYPLDKKRFDYEIETRMPIDLLSFFNRATGDILEYPKRGNHKNMEVRINKNSSYVKGSLHKYYNMDVLGEEHNHNDFSLCQCKYAIENLYNKFYIIPEKTKITNLEFGLNINLGFDPEIFINENLLMYDFNAHTRHENFKGKGDYKEFKRFSYSFKLYNKSKQFGLDEYVLRIEVKINDRNKVERLGVKNLLDLTTKEAHHSLFAFLLEQFEMLTIIDSQKLKKVLTSGETEKLSDYCNPNFWRVLKNEVSYKVYQRHIRDFENFGHKADVFRTKQTIYSLLKEKFNQQINCDANDIQLAA